MANWQNEIVIIVRGLVNDWEKTTYTDSRLKEIIVVAAQLLINDTTFDKSYTIDVDKVLISPDPTEPGSKDNGFINLTSLKAACIITASEARTHIKDGFVFKDGPSSIDTKSRAQYFIELNKDMCEAFFQALFQYQAGGSKVGAAVLTPYTSEVAVRQGNF